MKPLTKKEILKRRKKNPKDKSLHQAIETGEIKKTEGIFSPILIAVVVLIVLGAGGYLLYQKQNKPTTIPQPISQPTPSQIFPHLMKLLIGLL